MEIRERETGYLFLIRFLLLSGIFLLSLRFHILPAALTDSWARFNAWIASIIIHHLGLSAVRAGTVLSSGGASVDIEAECAAVEVYAIYFSAVLSTLRGLKEKLAGCAAGFAAISAVNLARIVMLFVVVAYGGKGFSLFHMYVGQAIVISVTFGVWRLWLDGANIRFRDGDLLEWAGRVAVFFVTVVIANAIYPLAINTQFASSWASLIAAHALWLLRFLGIGHQELAGEPGWDVISSCLAPPVTVLLIAFVAAARITPKKKFALAAAFLPFIYFLGLLKLGAIFLYNSAAAAAREGFFFNHFYPAVFTALLVTGALFTAYKENRPAAMRYCFYSVGVLIGAALLWHAIGGNYWRYCVEPGLLLFSKSSVLPIDPYLSLSSMPGWQFILSISLFAFLPGRPVKTNLVFLAGTLLLLFFWQMTIYAFFTTYPAPLRAGYFRLLSIAPPLVIWMLEVNRRKGNPSAGRASQSVAPKGVESH